MDYTAEHALQALEIIERLLPHVRPNSLYDELVAILRNPPRWHEAHELFSLIREDITLPYERKSKDDLDSFFVYVAENAAKTAYNCSGRPAPFDEDSFGWLLKCEKEFLVAMKED